MCNTAPRSTVARDGSAAGALGGVPWWSWKPCREKKGVEQGNCTDDAVLALLGGTYKRHCTGPYGMHTVAQCCTQIQAHGAEGLEHAEAGKGL